MRYHPRENETVKTTEGPSHILEITNKFLAEAPRLDAVLDQSAEARVRELVGLCRQFSQQYQEGQEACLARSWWRLFSQTGT
jgi:hypothetical protein